MTTLPGLEHRDKVRVAYVERFSDPEALTAFTEFPNAAFTPPDPRADAAWVRLSVIESDARLVELGGTRRWRTKGRMLVQLFLPLNKGERAGIDLAAKLVKAFRSITVDGVVYGTPSPKVIGRSGDWHQTTVSCPFQYDEIG